MLTILSFVLGLLERAGAALLRQLGPKAFAGLLLALALLVAWLGWRVHVAEARALRLALRADSTAAAADSTRRVDQAVQRLLGDSVLAVQRRAVQATQRADSLDRALGLERRIRLALTLQVRALDAIAQARVEADAVHDVRRATFQIRQAPYTATAAVVLPAPPGAGSIVLGVALDSARLGMRVGCGAAVAGVRPATVTVTGPPWLPVRLDQVEQDPIVCNGSAGLVSGRRGAGRWVPEAVLLGLGILVGTKL